MLTNPAPDISSRGWPIFFAIVLGFFYLLGDGLIFSRVQGWQTALWAAFPLGQFIYIGPLAYSRSKSGQRKAMQGWLIGAAISAVIYAPCWGLAWIIISQKR
ncbi:MAG TPA: hypothetical protein VGL89_11800 [Candidatus Koribacter sp.]|jgi:hypothetical protein